MNYKCYMYTLNGRNVGVVHLNHLYLTIAISVFKVRQNIKHDKTNYKNLNHDFAHQSLENPYQEVKNVSRSTVNEIISNPSLFR